MDYTVHGLLQARILELVAVPFSSASFQLRDQTQVSHIASRLHQLSYQGSPKKGKCQRTNAFKLWWWRRLLRVPWTARRSNQSILKEINPEHSLEGLILKLKFQYLTEARSWLTGKDPDAGKDWGREEKWPTEDEMVGWHHQLNGYKFEQISGDGEGQGSLVCCCPWGCKESDMT